MNKNNTAYYGGLTGIVVTPNDPLYDEARQEWNRAIQRFPAAIVYCKTGQDAANAVKWSRKRGVPLRIRSGGHHFEGYSTGNWVLVIDISLLTGIHLGEDSVTVEAGVRFEAFYEAVASKGYPFPGGSCPTVGLSGYTLGGGWGLSARLLGLGCDSLIEAEMVDFEGRLLKASAVSNPDLFWALRGAGGGNFGIVISMTYRLSPKVEKITTVEFAYPATGQVKQAQFLNAWQIWLFKANRRITAVASLYHTPEDGFAIYGFGLYYGSSQDAKKEMAPLEAVGGGLYEYIEMTLYEALKVVMEGYPPYEMFKSTGRFVLKPLSVEELLRTAGLIREVPEGSDLTALSLYAMGGRIGDTGRRDTAFFYRNALYIIGIQSVWSDPKYAKINEAWVEGRFQYLKCITEGSFVNFPISGLVDYTEEYFGLNAEKLRLVKEKYDPFNVFCFPQSIKPLRTCRDEQICTDAQACKGDQRYEDVQA